MNSLSQLRYFGNVAGNAGGFLIFLGILFLVATTIVFVFHNAARSEVANKLNNLRYTKDLEPEDIKKLVKEFNNITMPFSSWACLILVLICWFGAMMCPSQDTVYAIAASEMGEKAFETPLVTKAGKALEAWLDQKISPPTPPAQ